MSAAGATGAQGQDVSDIPDRFDLGRTVRGASRGFTVLLLGGVVQPWVGTLSPTAGYYWLVVVAVAAFIVAARSALPMGSPRGSWVNGPAAALASYVLVLPLVLSAAGTFPVEQVVLTAVTAVLTGSLSAWARVRRHS